MELDNYHTTSAAFQAQSARRYELSILAGVDSFAYIVKDRSVNELLAYRSVTLGVLSTQARTTALQQHLSTDPVLAEPVYGTVNVGWGEPRMSLVPKDLYSPNHRREYLEQLTEVSIEESVEEEWQNDLNAYLLYALRGEQVKAIREHLPEPSLQHVAGALLTTWGARSRRLGEDAISVCFRGHHLFIAAHRSGTLKFFNTFRYATPADALYYVLLAYEHTGMLPSRAPLYLSGEITERGEVFKLLYTYVQQVKFSRYGAPPRVAGELADLLPHLYFDLLCLG